MLRTMTAGLSTSLRGTDERSVAGSVPGAEGQDGVQATEGEGLRESNLCPHWAGLVGYYVQITVRIRLHVIRRGRQHAVAQGQYRGHRFDRSRRSKGVTVHRLGRTDGEGSVATEDRMDGLCLHTVIRLSCGSMRVDIANLLRS